MKKRSIMLVLSVFVVCVLGAQTFDLDDSQGHNGYPQAQSDRSLGYKF